MTKLFLPALLLFCFSCTSLPARMHFAGPLADPEGVTFFHDPAHEARQIYLAGTFNDWRADDPLYRMTLRKDGVWTLKVKLPPGRYQYKLVVDDTFTRDYDNPATAPSGFDEPNSLVVVP